MRMNVSDIVQCCAGRLLAGQADALVTGTTWDSRKVASGDMYIALPGKRVDGHQFCVDAARAQAAALLVSTEPNSADQAAIAECGCAIIVVDDVPVALSALAGAWRMRLQGRVVALTGSSGKTTTKNLVRDVLSAAGSVVATEANQNNELGVPATLLRAQEDTDYIVVEMGMRGLGQLAELCSFVRPDCALVTNVGTSHMELLGSRDAIARAKAEPFTFLDAACGCAFINASDSYAAKLVEYGGLAERGVATVFFDGSGESPAAYNPAFQPKVYASDISFDEAALPHFTINVPGSSAPCTLQLAGAHSVHNALAAAALGYHAGLDAAAIAGALEASQPASGRQALRTAACGACIVDDSYNANPDSMCASLAAFAGMVVPGRRVAVLGDMYELGDFTEEGHALAGAKAASCGIDQLICVGPLAEGIASAALEGGMDEMCVSCVAAAADALDALAGVLHEGDAVLVKASHGVRLDSLVEGLVG